MISWLFGARFSAWDLFWLALVALVLAEPRLPWWAGVPVLLCWTVGQAVFEWAARRRVRRAIVQSMRP